MGSLAEKVWCWNIEINTSYSNSMVFYVSSWTQMIYHKSFYDQRALVFGLRDIMLEIKVGCWLEIHAYMGLYSSSLFFKHNCFLLKRFRYFKCICQPTLIWCNANIRRLLRYVYFCTWWLISCLDLVSFWRWCLLSFFCFKLFLGILFPWSRAGFFCRNIKIDRNIILFMVS